MLTADTARWYDLFTDPQTADVDWYVARAREEGGPIAELGAGSGRITVPMARAGVDVHAVDISAPMLDRMALRLQGEAEAVHARIERFEGDMRVFGHDEAYQQVFLPYRSFLHMATAQDRHQCLWNAWRILKPGGRLALNFFHPEPGVLQRASGDQARAWWDLGVHEGADGTVVRCQQQGRLDLLNKVMHMRFRWVEEREEEARVVEEGFTAGLVFRDELVLHLELAGFALEEVRGDFEGALLERADQEVVVTARKVS
ncbi:MAG: class I SAM-dependent methyltransferase [Alphaproteobacteria bacterium]|nr:class I SAM-dependent methyltransferase [Alphaproteobacteria bacterium]